MICSVVGSDAEVVQRKVACKCRSVFQTMLKLLLYNFPPNKRARTIATHALVATEEETCVCMRSLHKMPQTIRGRTSEVRLGRLQQTVQMMQVVDILYDMLRRYLSTSPNTKSIVPMIATASARRWPLEIWSKQLRCANPGALILHRYGLSLPSLTT